MIANACNSSVSIPHKRPMHMGAFGGVCNLQSMKLVAMDGAKMVLGGVY